MTVESQPDKVKLICGMISADVDLFTEACEMMVGHFGPIDIFSEVIDFDFTEYYNRQMGSPLFRKFVSFERLISPDQLAAAKRVTNSIEGVFATRPGVEVSRPVNLDPGYIAPSKLVLASMKDFSHRIALDGGVFGEITLLYKGNWQSLQWTFPDYGSRRYDRFLTDVRERLAKQR